MLMLLLVGTAGSVAVGPFVGVAVYYLFAVLRPQYIWEWALWEWGLIDVRWSLYVALATMVATVIYLPRVLSGKSLSAGHYAMLAFALWVTLSHIYAANKEVSWIWYQEYLKIFIMFFCSSFVIKEFIQVRRLYLIALITLGYISYELNFYYLINGRIDIWHLGYGGLDNNGAGLMIAMGIPMAYFMWQGYDRWWRWIFLGMVPVMLHAVLLSFSRGAMLSLLLVVPLLVIRSSRKSGMILFMVGIMFLLPVLAGTEVRSRFLSIQGYEEDNSAEARFDSWKAGLRIANRVPILGVGVRNADLYSYYFGADTRGRTIHSQYIQIAADNGYPGLMFYLLVFFAAWRSLRRMQKQYGKLTSENDKLAYNLACGIEGSLAIFSMGSFFLSLEVFELPYLLVLLALKLPLTVDDESQKRAYEGAIGNTNFEFNPNLLVPGSLKRAIIK